MRRVLFVSVLAIGLLALPSQPRAQANRLQIHFMDVGQGDGAILIAPDGETVLFDNGVWGSCTKPLTVTYNLGADRTPASIDLPDFSGANPAWRVR